MNGCPSRSFINRDYIKPTDSRPIFCPILEKKMSADGKKTTVIFLSSVDIFEVLVIGLTSVDRRPTIDRLLMKNKPFKLCRLLADHRPTIGRQSADDLFIGRSFIDCWPTKLTVGRLSADDRPIVGPHIFIAFVYAHLVIFVFSICFLPLAESDLVQTINSIILYNMRMRTKAKMSYVY